MLRLQQFHWDKITGWAAVVISVTILCFWAFWGINENFHEGWCYRNVSQNVGLMLVQYLSPVLILLLPALAALKWPRWSLVFFSVLAVVVLGFFGFRNNASTRLVVAPLLLMGVLYELGRPEPRKWAFRAVVGLPLLTAIVSGAVSGWRAIGRLNDGNYGARRVEGNGVTLVWAPEGPGWPDHGASWWDAEDKCKYLTPDGQAVASSPQNVWHLPTVDKAVRSMAYRGKYAGGVCEAQTAPQQVVVSRSRVESARDAVKTAWAAVEQARLNLEYTKIVAPVDGIVGKKSREVGENVRPGQALMAIAPIYDLYVTANFKETQLKNMRPGQPLAIHVDVYARDYRGHVLSIAEATGERFSLLPPENASGNYVKVIQRVPVKIDLDPGQNTYGGRACRSSTP